VAYTCLGYTNNQIAVQLGLSVETVKTHVGNLLVKFGLHSKVELRMTLSEWDFRGWERNTHI
jgi:DNA-binding CsgD family transcriptional regulator